MKRFFKRDSLFALTPFDCVFHPSSRLERAEGQRVKEIHPSRRCLSSPGLLPESRTSCHFTWTQLVLQREPPTRGALAGADRVESRGPGAASQHTLSVFQTGGHPMCLMKGRESLTSAFGPLQCQSKHVVYS